MWERARLLAAAACVAALWCINASAQTAGRRQAEPQAQEPPPAVVSSDPMVNEIALLRKAVQTLNTRLREISEKLFEADATGAVGAAAGTSGGAAAGKQGPLAQNLNILTLAEQRAEVMRRQLLEMIERETSYRNRLAQLDEEMRPESIDRNLTLVGTTRSTTDLRDARRRVLDNEHKGVENLLNQASASRARLEEDLRLADLMVSRIRQKLLPLIDREIDKLAPNP